MKPILEILTPRRALAVGALTIIFASTVAAAAVFGAMSRHSARFPLDVISRTADSIWAAYKHSDDPPPVPMGDDVTFETTFTRLHGKVFHIPISDRGGEGGAVTSVGGTLLLLTHDGRFFAGTAEEGFRQMSDIAPPENGFQAYYDLTQQPPYDPKSQNYANFRYNDIAFSRTRAGASLIASYTYFDKDKACYTTRIARYDLPAGEVSVESLAIAAADWRVFFETAPCLQLRAPGPSIYVQEAAGRIVVDAAASTIYLASGNYDVISLNGHLLAEGEAPVAQDPTTDYGKILAIDLDTGAARHFAVGFRNPQGITQDRDGRIWTVEHGMHAGDELNLVEEGANYGYPLAMAGKPYEGHPDPGVISIGRHTGFREPVYAWLPSTGPGSIMSVRGFDPNWDGDLLVGALAGDDGGRKLIHIRIDDDRVVFTENIPVGRKVRHLHQHTDGSIVLWNGNSDIVILTPGAAQDGALVAQSIIQELNLSDPVRTAVQAELSECLQCHSLEPDESAKAPSLAAVFGANIASTGFPHYSDALRRERGAWSRDDLIAFLADPNGEVPGTSMPNPGIASSDVRAAIVDVLAGVAGSKS